MTREEALLKLLAVEPETRDRLIVVTGWPAEETAAVLDKLLAEKRVGYGNGPYAAEGRRRYFPREVRV
jgi:hypothetical protein